MNDNNYEARASDVDLERITSSTHNALILEKLRSNDDEFTTLGIVGVDHNWPDEEDFIVEEGDNLGWLGYFIGKSKQLGSLWVFHLPGDDSFRQGLAQNQSIQELHICRDLGEAGFQSLAPFFHNNNTLEELNLSLSINSLECAKNIASLLGLRQIKSLKRIVFENDLIGDGFVAIAHALRAQPQLEELILSLESTDMEDAPFGQRGCAALGATMKNVRSSSLKKLVIHASDFDDDGLLSLVEGMANCVNLEHLDLDGNDQITEIGLSALSDLFRSKKFYLQELDLSYMAIHDDGMICLAAGAASIMTLKSLDLSRNAFGDEGLQAMAVGLSNSKNLESLNLSVNGPFSAIGLRSLSDMIPAALKVLCLASNGINDEGLQALAVGLGKHITIETLNLSGNEIGSAGVRALTAAEITSLRSLGLASNAIDDEALKVLVEGIETLSIETLNLAMNNMITSSGLAVLTPIFRRKSCSLKKIDLDPTNIGDSVAKDFAEGLVRNESLTNLLFGYTNVTALGWSAFSTLLCDTSSITNTYLSNHTLERIGSSYFFSHEDHIPSSFQQYLELNRQNQYDAPICKILMSHSNLDMTPLFQCNLKLLPFVLAWFERARSCRDYVEESITKFERRELSALYQFIHGLPLLAASGFYKHMSTDAHSKKRKFDQCDK